MVPCSFPLGSIIGLSKHLFLGSCRKRETAYLNVKMLSFRLPHLVVDMGVWEPNGGAPFLNPTYLFSQDIHCHVKKQWLSTVCWWMGWGRELIPFCNYRQKQNYIGITSIERMVFINQYTALDSFKRNQEQEFREKDIKNLNLLGLNRFHTFYSFVALEFQFELNKSTVHCFFNTITPQQHLSVFFCKLN